MTWGAAYLLLVAALFVRVRTANEPPRMPGLPLPGEPLRLLMLHHRVFYCLLGFVPLEVLWRGADDTGRAVGAVMFAAGVWLYRRGGDDLGPSRSPFVLPRVGASLVTEGLYAWVRHPMYLGQALIAIGAPLTLGARWSFVLTIVALTVLLLRVRREEAALAERFPGYGAYVARTKRLIPHLF